MRVLVTGATGFVGTALCRELKNRGISLRRAVRSPDDAVATGDDIAVGEIGPSTSWDQALKNVDIVVHLAARTHVMHETAADPLAEYRRINVQATQALATAAGNAGVRRFIFLSSIKVNGESTGGRAFTEMDTPRPEDRYGMSKWEAEQALQVAAACSGMETVILRVPLLYGPGVKGNFLGLMRAIDRGLPLPFASVRNRRSLLFLGNLVDALILCLDHPGAAGKTYLLADDEGISTADMTRAIAHALGRSARLFPCPPGFLKFAGAIANKSAAMSRLLGSLQVDSGKFRGELGWQPRFSMPVGLRETADWYVKTVKRYER